MRLDQLIQRTMPPAPWAEGENIPWFEPAFSARMLREHLSQDHNLASRQETLIEQQVGWIHRALLHARATTVLDLGCGPGLYTQRLARLGHVCVGVDYSPAAIAYARQQAEEEGLTCRYELRDMRAGGYGRYGVEFGLAMLIYGELNVFPRETAAEILRAMSASLVTGGILLLEAHTDDAVREMGTEGSTWRTAERGLFGDRPYLCLTENFWHPGVRAATTRTFVIETATGTMTRYAQTMQAYTAEEYSTLLTSCGFTAPTFHGGLAGDGQHEQQGLCAITARKR
jgi:SAM-dependent methyltransferase